MVTYRIVGENVVRNFVKRHATSCLVRVPMKWLGREVEVRLLEASPDNGAVKPQ